MSFKCALHNSALFKIAQTIRVARGVFLFTFLMGSQLGWSSPNLARFVSGQSGVVDLDSQQVSWCAGLPSLGSVCGAGLGLCSLALLGSRNSIILVLGLMTAKWIMWLFADSAAHVYLFQWICGLSNIMGMNLFSLYLGDVSPADLRGTIISVCLNGHSVGLLVATLVETHLERRHSVPLYLLLTSTAIGLFLWVRDSPYHLIKRGRRREAELAIAAYFPRCDPVDKYAEISDYVTRSQSSATSSLKSLAVELKDGVVRRGMLVVFLVFAIPQLSGYLVMIFYAEQIFSKSASADLMAPRLFVNCMFAASCLATCCCVKLIDHIGRRKLFVVSSLGTCLSLSGLAAHFHLLERDDAIDSEVASYLRYLPIVCMPLYMAFSSVGYLSVPAATLSELVPANLRSVAVCLSCLSMAVPGFCVTKLYQPACDYLGEAWPFWIYAAFTLTALPVSLLLLPETKGKSLLEIQNDLQN
uniref:Major facilitator superfamily (MFS) profile domain-containing protein n=1 Tax=Trichogramma kaykai TaxID=54128 RepID=A0ABD2X8T0_9HYME